jgi:hypothetical protein
VDHQEASGAEPERTSEPHHRGARWHPAPLPGQDRLTTPRPLLRSNEPDLAGDDDALASEALARRARERHADFLEWAARYLGRALSVQEQNLWIAQAEQIGEL